MIIHFGTEWVEVRFLRVRWLIFPFVELRERAETQHHFLEQVKANGFANFIYDLLPQFGWYFPGGESSVQIFSGNYPILVIIEILESDDKLVVGPASLGREDQPGCVVDLAIFAEVCLQHDSVGDVAKILILDEGVLLDKCLQNNQTINRPSRRAQLIEDFRLFWPIFRAESVRQEHERKTLQNARQSEVSQSQ